MRYACFCVLPQSRGPPREGAGGYTLTFTAKPVCAYPGAYVAGIRSQLEIPVRGSAESLDLSCVEEDREGFEKAGQRGRVYMD